MTEGPRVENQPRNIYEKIDQEWPVLKEQIKLRIGKVKSDVRFFFKYKCKIKKEKDK